MEGHLDTLVVSPVLNEHNQIRLRLPVNRRNAISCATKNWCSYPQVYIERYKWYLTRHLTGVDSRTSSSSNFLYNICIMDLPPVNNLFGSRERGWHTGIKICSSSILRTNCNRKLLTPSFWLPVPLFWFFPPFVARKLKGRGRNQLSVQPFLESVLLFE